MPDSTAVYELPYPLGTEPANGPGDIKNLADAVEAALVDSPEFTAVTYNGAWTDYGTPYEEVSAALFAQGVVRLRGSAKHATTSTTGTVFTLPTGHRPAKTRRFEINANTGSALITIDSAGVVSVIVYLSPGGGTGNGSILSFDQVSFDVAP